MFHKVYYIFEYSIMLDISAKNTVFWDRVETSNRPNQRIDNLVSFTRIYVIEYKKYLYRLCLGRLRVLFAKR